MHAVLSSGLLARHPRLRLCFAHAGGAYLPLLGRIQHGFDRRPDLVAHSAGGRSPAGQLRPGQRNVWVDSLAHDADLLELVCRKLGPDRVLLGSDYPFPLGETPVAGDMVATAERFDEGARARMLGANALEFLGLPGGLP